VDIRVIWGDGKQEYFCGRGWTDHVNKSPTGKSLGSLRGSLLNSCGVPGFLRPDRQAIWRHQISLELELIVEQNRHEVLNRFASTAVDKCKAELVLEEKVSVETFELRFTYFNKIRFF